MKIEKIDNNYPYNLLLLADETVEGIDKYLYESDVYVAKTADEAIGVFCLFQVDEDVVEIKNIAVVPQMQNRGVGSHLMNEIEIIARKKQYKTIIVGTGDCGINQIRFYERNGYSKYAVKKDFFLKIYSEPIYENGIMLRDMVMLKKEISCFKVEKAYPDDYHEIIDVWKSSVKATHDFLSLEDFDFYIELLPLALASVDLYIIRSENTVTAFIGISEESIEMLFVSDESRGKGYGKALIEYAINEFHVKKVDVNEQNKQAIGFYEKFGFKIISRSEIDSMGKNYPILHMSR